MPIKDGHFLWLNHSLLVRFHITYRLQHHAAFALKLRRKIMLWLVVLPLVLLLLSLLLCFSVAAAVVLWEFVRQVK